MIGREEIKKLKNQAIGRIIYAYKEIVKNKDSCIIGESDKHEEKWSSSGQYMTADRQGSGWNRYLIT